MYYRERDYGENVTLMSTSELLKNYYSISADIYLLDCLQQLLEWDQQVYMPKQAAEFRARQIEYLSRLAHENRSSESYLRLVSELTEKADKLKEEDKANVKVSLELIEKSRRLPADFVARKAKSSAQAYTAWVEARNKDDFEMIIPFLKENVELSLQEAELLGYEECAYDALLDNYDRGSKLSAIKAVLTRLGEGLRDMLPTIQSRQQESRPACNSYAILDQEKLNVFLLKKLGYSFECGRLDTTIHPFMTTIGPRDKRITTRYAEDDFLSSLLTALHEGGHALYELGLWEDYIGTPLGSTESLSIHESQSRILENIIGRSRPFSEFIHRSLEEFFPEEFKKTTPEDLWNRLNYVDPSLIRVEADEVTYSLHIIIRLQLETELFTEGLPVEELPERWNALYRDYLDIEVPNNKLGVLQDVHWYGVGFGYFPTYALGNLYSAIMMNCLRATIPGVDTLIANGEFNQILSWLRSNVHQHGMRYKGLELIKKLSGAELSEKPFLGYIKDKFTL